MINRTLLRIKVIQILYSYYKNKENETAELESAQNELIESTNKTYELYHYFFLLIIKITEYVQKLAKKSGNARNEYGKLANNIFVKQLANNKQLLAYFDEPGVDWANKTEDGELFWDIQNEEQQNNLTK